MLLPVGPGERRGRSPRDWLVDVVAGLVAIGVSMVSLDGISQVAGGVWIVLDVAAGALLWAGLWVRRSHPFALGVAASLATAVAAAAAGPALIATFNAALRCSRRQLAVVASIALGGTAIFPWVHPSESPYPTDLVIGELLTLVVIGWALVVRARRETVQALRERAEHLQAERDLHVELARTSERQRIAREMHDVLAHRISLLAVHAGALEYRYDDPAEAGAVALIRRTAHDALQDLREVIGMLREGEREHGPPEAPQPTLAQIPELIEQSRAAGMRIRTSIALPSGGVNDLIGRTAYRVIQEGLTNARKHAPATTVDVALSSDGALVVEIVSRCAVGASSGLPGAGVGLVGLAERVALAHGRLEHGPDASGNFRLRATLPL